MKKILDWQNPAIVAVFDEATLWSAPFGQILLENIPMKRKAQVLDIGFGTGFPLIELAQRFGPESTIYGIDIWKEGIELTKKKIKLFEIETVTIFEQSATEIPMPNASLDLITSNLGVNNFEEKTQVYREIFRTLKKEGTLAITTNPIGTFVELFAIFEEVNIEQQLEIDTGLFSAHRGTEATIVGELEAADFRLKKKLKKTGIMRFVDAKAIFDHALIRIGFMASWLPIIPQKSQGIFFDKVIEKIEATIEKKGVFEMTIPMLYLEFQKR